jgi:hypothetical protein
MTETKMKIVVGFSLADSAIVAANAHSHRLFSNLTSYANTSHALSISTLFAPTHLSYIITTINTTTQTSSNTAFSSISSNQPLSSDSTPSTSDGTTEALARCDRTAVTH